MADKLIAKIDIHKIIDDAMEKKDRTVYILINGENTSISVTPLGESDPRWILNEDEQEEQTDRVFVPITFSCSECGFISRDPSPYCPMCGEKLKCK
jgi:hypothetical protein